MKFRILFTTFIFLCYTAFPNIDSLIVLFENTVETNKVYSQLAFEIGVAYYDENNYSDALEYFNLGLSGSKDKGMQADLYKNIGTLYIDSANYDLALENLALACEIYFDLKMMDEIPSIKDYEGMCYGLSNNLDKAIEKFKESLHYSYEIEDSSGLGYSYYNIGLAHYFKGEYKKAIENYLAALKIREQLTDTTVMVTSYTTLAELFRVRGENEKALSYYSKALSLKSSIKNDEILSYVYSELALLKKNSREYSESLAYIDTALTYSEACDYKRGIITLHAYEADIQFELDQPHKALELYKKVLDGYIEINYDKGIVQTKIDLAECFLEINKFKPVENYLDEALFMATIEKLLDEQMEVHRVYYELYKKTNSWSNALIAHEKFVVFKDSIFNVEKEVKIEELETEYQVEKKESEIQLLDAENKLQLNQLQLQRYIIITASSLFLLIVIVGILFFRQSKLKAKLEVEYNRQKLLRSQMNPHFIYNSLSAIQNFILQNNPIDSVTYIAEFSSLMRLVLNGSRSDFIALEDDVRLAKSFLKLQQLRFNHIFQYEVVVDNNVDVEINEVPPMLTQPFIENAVEHGMRNKKAGEGLIKISYQKSEQNLLITIYDNGAGIKPSENNKKHNSLAMKITNERVENIKKLHQLEIGFAIDSEAASGTTITFRIPIKLNK